MCAGKGARAQPSPETNARSRRVRRDKQIACAPGQTRPLENRLDRRAGMNKSIACHANRSNVTKRGGHVSSSSRRTRTDIFFAANRPHRRLPQCRSSSRISKTKAETTLYACSAFTHVKADMTPAGVQKLRLQLRNGRLNSPTCGVLSTASVRCPSLNRGKPPLKPTKSRFGPFAGGRPAREEST